MAGLAESLFPRSSKLGHLSGYHPRALLGAVLDVASLPGRAYASLGRMEDESYLDALGRTVPRYVVGQGEGDEMADAILRDPLTPAGFGVGAAIKGLRPILGLGADLGTNAAGMAADQYATTGSVNGTEIGAGAGMGALLGLGGMAKGGKRSMISPEERAANFRNWFGDSKVVDEAGKPLVVHHGTYSQPFNEFDVSGESGLHPTARIGAFFTPSKEVAGSFGNRIEDVYISSKNPYEISAEDYYNIFSREKEFERLRNLNSQKAMDAIESALGGEGGLPDRFISKRVENLIKEMNASGSDALLVKAYDPDWDDIPEKALRGNWKELTNDVWVARSPTQIKSATGNRGTFDPNDPNITHFAGSASAPSRNRATTRLERQAAQVAYDKYGRPREESAGRPVSTFQGLGSLLSSPSDTYYTRGGR